MVISNFTFDGTTKDPMQQKAIRDAPIGFMAAMGGPRPNPPSSPCGPGLRGPDRRRPARPRRAPTLYGRKPSFTREQLDMVRAVLDQDAGISEIAKRAGVSCQTFYRIKADQAHRTAAR
jgi:putative DNA-invertase from lambdoid prophage Rac